MNRRLLFCLALCAPMLAAWAQQRDTTPTLSLHIEGTHFFRNNEYGAELVDGYTLPGFSLHPYLRWQANSRVSVEGGVYWLYYWGAHHYPAALSYQGLPRWSDTTRALHLLPWMRATVGLGQGVDLLIGSLDRTDAHRLPLPLYNPEYLYTSDPEAGIQLRIDRSWLASDLWVDWREMIFRQSPTKEQFTFGLHTTPRLNLGQGWSLTASGLLIAAHEGGNFVADSTKPINRLNYGAGVGIHYQQSDEVQAHLQAYLLGYHSHHDPLPPFETGHGLYVSASASLHSLSAEAGWWRGYQFIPLMGSYHFSNLSSTTPDLHFDTRDMLAARCTYRYTQLPHTTLVFELEYYHYFPYTGDRDHPDYPAKVVCGHANGFGIGVELHFNPSITLVK